MSTAYVRDLYEQIPTSQPAPERMSLKKRFIEWYGALPSFNKSRPFSMSELEGAMQTQGKYLSPVLSSLGWSRRRIYSTAGPYHRYWMPPG